MNIYSIISIASAALSLGLGFVVITLNPRSRLHAWFFAFSLSVAYLGFTEFEYRESPDLEGAMLWLKLSMLTPLVPALFLSFALRYATSKRIWGKILVNALIFLPAIFFIGIDMRTSWISGAPLRTSWGWGYSIPRKEWHFPYAFWFSGILLAVSIASILYFVQERTERKRLQARLIAIGFSVPVILGLGTEVVAPYTDIQFPELTTLGFVISNIIIAYAIGRYKFLVLSPVSAADRIIDTMSDSLFLTDPQGTIEFVNAAAVRMMGCSEDALIGQTIQEQFFEWNEIGTRFDSIVTSGGAMSDVAATIKTRDGRRVPASLSGSVMRNHFRGIRGIIIIIRDISERISAQEALRQARDELEERVRLRTKELAYAKARLEDEKEQLAVTLGSIGDGVITTDTSGNIVMLNNRAEALTGWQQEDASGCPLDRVFNVLRTNSSTRLLNPVDEVLRSGSTVEIPDDAILVACDGTRKHIADSAAPIKHTSGEIIGVVIVFRDITEKQRMEIELLKMKKLESIGILAGGIAHDFNNLLAIMLPNLFMTKLTVGKGAEALSFINDTEQAVLRAQRLTAQLLTFSKGGEPIKERISMKLLIEDTIGFLLSGSAVDYKLQFDSELMEVEADKGQIDQVMSNLVFNAEQAMPQGGTIAISACTVILDEDHTANDTPSGAMSRLVPGPYIKVSVADDGVGIARHLLDKIFDPFFSTKEAGRGMGLSIVYSIIKKHGGRVTVDSIEGRGSTFSFYLPAIPAVDEKEPQSESSRKEGEREGTARILLMDDEVLIAKAITLMLTRLGHTVTTVADGKEALDKYRCAFGTADAFNVVILDLTVQGGMGGKECIEHLKKIDPRVKTIVSSGYSYNPVMARYRDYGFTCALSKPYSVSELSSAIEYCISENA